MPDFASALPTTPIDSGAVGVIVPYDFALDREIWRWVPPSVTLHLTRTSYAAVPVGVTQALLVGDPAEIAALARNVSVVGPQVALYLCTAGSFARGRDGERELREAMTSSGIPLAVTTSGALLESAATLGIGRIAIATPYDDLVTDLLAAYLEAAGLTVTGRSRLGLTGGIWRLTHREVADLVRDAVSGSERADAVFVSCTNVRTYDLIGPLERELGMPVLTANQVSMWAALRALGLCANGDGRLCASS